MTSTRLPGKVLADLAGRPVLEHVVRRALAAAHIDDVVVATTVNSSDDPLIALADRLGVRWHRGDEHDVLSRYVDAARETAAATVVRITADCPLTDPAVIDAVCSALQQRRNACDYASNAVVRSFPRGLDVEVMFADVLDRVNRIATEPAEREHVTMAIYSTHADVFLRHDVLADRDDSDLRWTVDYPIDLEVIREAYVALDLAEHHRPYSEVVTWFRENPSVSSKNADLTTWEPKRPA
jgi:spore coat polysaccharide biosynthesis protein SpsF